MGLLDFIFWKGVKRYSYTLFDVSEDGEFIKGMKQAYTRPGITYSITFDSLGRDRELKVLETELGCFKEDIEYEQRSGRADAEDVKLLQTTEGLLRLLKADKIRVFSAVVEVDTDYITKGEKNDLIEVREGLQDRVLRRLMEENPE